MAAIARGQAKKCWSWRGQMGLGFTLVRVRMVCSQASWFIALPWQAMAVPPPNYSGRPRCETSSSHNPRAIFMASFGLGWVSEWVNILAKILAAVVAMNSSLLISCIGASSVVDKLILAATPLMILPRKVLNVQASLITNGRFLAVDTLLIGRPGP